MRDIRFRAWDKDRMVKGFELFEDNSAYRGAIPMQFTGLLDKNGEEIYEGDLVREWLTEFKPSELTYKVGFDRGHFTLKDIKSGYDRLGIWNVHKNMEVIGNIYKNPELIKAVEKGNI